MGKSKMRLGYIVRYGGDKPKFGFREFSYTRRITSRGDRVYSNMMMPVDYEDVKLTTDQMKEEGIVIVGEPFFLDDELRTKTIRWVEWANNVDPKEYDPFFEAKTDEDT